MPKQLLYKNFNDTIQTIAGKDKGIHAFPQNISPKVNVIPQLDFELASMILQSNTLTTMTRGLLSWYILQC